MNHALEADYFHTRERLGLGSNGLDAALARIHARLAGRLAVGDDTAAVCALHHVDSFPALRNEYFVGYLEAKNGSISAIDTRCLTESARLTHLVQARHTSSAGDSEFDHSVMGVVEAIFDIAADNPDIRPLPYIPQSEAMRKLAETAATYRRDLAWIDEAANRKAEFEASLPTGAELMHDIQTKTSKEGDSFDFHGYTLWYEPEHGGWSLTNAYGVDNCAFLATEGRFNWLIDMVRRGKEIGPVPPMCEDPDDDLENHPDASRLDVCLDVYHEVIQSLNNVPTDPQTMQTERSVEIEGIAFSD